VSDLLQAACVGLALVSAAAVLGSSRDLRLGVRVVLDLLLAAGLLRLADAPGWRDVVAVAALVLVRRVVH
jgi:uncharacterized membrane protein